MSNISGIIKSIQAIMRKDVGVDGDAQRISQLVWMFFLKIYDDREEEIELLEDGVLIGSGTVADNGEWRITVEEPALGLNDYAARFGGTEASIGESITVRIVTASEERDCSNNPGIDRSPEYIVGTCDTLGTITDAFDLVFEDLVEANPQIENLDLIYPGDTINLP